MVIALVDASIGAYWPRFSGSMVCYCDRQNFGGNVLILFSLVSQRLEKLDLTTNVRNSTRSKQCNKVDTSALLCKKLIGMRQENMKTISSPRFFQS